MKNGDGMPVPETILMYDMYMKYALVDDDKNVLDLFGKALKRNGIEIDMDYFRQSEFFLSVAEQYDVVFLDIAIETDSEGIQLAKILRKHFPTLMVVFLSSHSELILETFNTNVLGFISKDYQDRDIQNVFKRINGEKALRRSILLTEYDSTRRFAIPLMDIRYVYVENKAVYVCMENKRMRIRGYTFQSLFDELNQYSNFLMVGRSVFINMWYVEKTEDNDIWLLGIDQPIPVPRRLADSVFSSINEYLSE